MEPRLRIDPTALGDIALFSRRQAREWGISDKDLEILCRRGLLIRVARGWYSTRVGAPADELHLLRVAATLQGLGPTVAATAHSAVLAHGLPVLRTPLEIVELTRPGSTHGRVKGGSRTSVQHETPDPVWIEAIGRSVRCAPVAAAVIDTALVGTQIGAMVAGDAALRLGRCTTDDLRQAIERRRGCRGVERARAAVALMDPRHESPGETVTHHVFRGLGWDLVPQVEVTVRDRHYRLDLGVEGEQAGVEHDGAGKYDEPGALFAEKRREDDLRSVGWHLVRVVSDDHDDLVRLNQRLRDAVERSRRAA